MDKTRIAALSYNNGTIANIAQIPGSHAYGKLMRQYTEHPDRLDPPLIDTPQQKLQALWTFLCRHLNLLLGYPATNDTAVISEMLKSLRLATEAHLGLPVATVGLAAPRSTHLSLDEINDALVYAGLEKAGSGPGHPLRLSEELNAAYGAYGYGLCPSYKDPYLCEAEEDQFGEGEVVLHLDYTNHTLAANVDWIKSARQTGAQVRFVDWELGMEGKEKFEEDDLYWSAVRQRIRDLTMTAKRPYDRLLLTGERANDEKFLKVVKDGLSGIRAGERLPAVTADALVDPLFVVARGTAEFQRRWQQGWFECVQPRGCRSTGVKYSQEQGIEL